MRTASDLSFELVAVADGATLYVIDHGKTMTSAGVERQTDGTSTAEKVRGRPWPAGGNKPAKGVKLGSR